MSNDLTNVSASRLITLALRAAGVFGVGETPLAEDFNDSLLTLNAMLGQWQRKRWLVYVLEDKVITSTGAQFYTIGPGGNISVLQRPDRIASAFFRQMINSTTSANNVDYPLEIITARETYNQIALKQLSTFPQYLFYATEYPLGKLYPWPVLPATTFELHISIKVLLPSFPNLATVFSLPPEYFAALWYNLAQRLAPNYGKKAPDDIIALAKDALNVLRKANTQIAELSLPAEILRDGNYNVFSDRYN